jgi:hypothetical protein
MEKSFLETAPQNLSNQIADLVEKLCGQNEYIGHHPFEIQIVSEKTAFFIQIRKGEDWITIQQQEAENPRLVKSYSFDKEGSEWKYIDPDKIKYGTSSEDELVKIVERLKAAEKGLRPEELG